jgi:hypothetical protein
VPTPEGATAFFHQRSDIHESRYGNELFPNGTALPETSDVSPFFLLYPLLTGPHFCTTIAVMSRSDVPRRVKSYSSATGYTYQYVFHEIRKGRRGLSFGNEFIYQVSADRKTSFPVVIFIPREAVQGWSKKSGRAITGTEEYAAAKMRLYQAFDEVEDLAVSRPTFDVDEEALNELLMKLDL